MTPPDCLAGRTDLARRRGQIVGAAAISPPDLAVAVDVAYTASHRPPPPSPTPVDLTGRRRGGAVVVAAATDGRMDFVR